MKTFDFYEFTGLLLPGLTLIAGVCAIYPSLRVLALRPDLTIGATGLLLAMAYAVGHLTQAVGNLVESLWWARRGVPTDWVRTGRGHLLAPAQRDAIPGTLHGVLGIQMPEKLEDLSVSEWRGIVRQIYAAVSARGRASRIDIFNGNYGMFRGLASALAVLLAFVALEYGLEQWRVELLVLTAAAMAIYRMNRFAIHYARELMVELLQLPHSRPTVDHGGT